MRHAILLVAALSLLFVGATVHVTYTLNPQEAHVQYEVVVEQAPITIQIPQDAVDLRVNNASVAYQRALVVQETGSNTVTYTTQSVLEGRQNPYFVADLTRIESELSGVDVLLAPGAVLAQSLNHEQPSINPRPTATSTDGERLIFSWTPQALEPARAIFIRYQTPSAFPLTLVLAISLALIVATILLATTRLKRRVQEKTMNLYGAEKALVKILLDAPEDGMWQNELVHKSGLSKVKVSRKLRNLEQKGVIEKIPHGNTNRIRLT